MSENGTIIYHAFVDDNTRCHVCGCKAVLLSPRELTVPLGEGFYICFRCMDIGQIGVANLKIRGITKLRNSIRTELKQ
jgi:hypothetical protein